MPQDSIPVFKFAGRKHGSTAKLPFFIAYASHWTKLHHAVTLAFLVPTCRALSNHPIHDCLQGHLRRQLLKRAMDHSCGGHLQSQRSQPDGVRNVLYFGWVAMVDDVRLEGLQDLGQTRCRLCSRPITAYSLNSAAPLPEPSHPSSPISVFASRSRHPSSASSESSPDNVARGRKRIVRRLVAQNTPFPSYSACSPAPSESLTTSTGLNDWSARIHRVDKPTGCALVRASKATDR